VQNSALLTPKARGAKAQGPGRFALRRDGALVRAARWSSIARRRRTLYGLPRARA